MNRETSAFESSDTLVVVDRSRRRRTLLIAAGLAVIVLIVAFMLMRGGSDEQAAGTGQGAQGGQIPTVTVGAEAAPLGSAMPPAGFSSPPRRKKTATRSATTARPAAMKTIRRRRDRSTTTRVSELLKAEFSRFILTSFALFANLAAIRRHCITRISQWPQLTRCKRALLQFFDQRRHLLCKGALAHTAVRRTRMGG